MKTWKVYAILLLAASLLCAGACQGAKKKSKKVKEANEPTQLDRTIGDLAETIALNPIPVKGIGLVVGLAGTGSSECPEQTRDYLRKYIMTQIGRKDLINPDDMINSLDTAVVLVEGFIPIAASKYQPFDVTVRALDGTQTTSLAGGRLYTTELKMIAKVEESIETSRALAYAAGPIFLDLLSDAKPNMIRGRILGGGKVIDDYPITLALFKPDFRAAAYIRNRVNQRFGKETANAVSESTIYVTIPDDYKDKKARFVLLLKHLYIASNAALEQTRITELIEQLKTAEDKTKIQIALEAIGRPAVEELQPLVDSNDEKIKFAAACTLMAIGDDQGLKPLREFAQNRDSQFRLQALQTVGEYGQKYDVLALMNRVVSDETFEIKYAAYTYMKRFDDPSIISISVADDFFVDQVITSGPKTIYASQMQNAGIVLFGAPLDCEKGIYIESDDGSIIINSEPTDDRISILRKHPITGGLMGPLKCSTRIADIIKLLGDPPAPKDSKKRPGLGVPYYEIIKMLKVMSDKGAVKANFIAGPVK